MMNSTKHLRLNLLTKKEIKINDLDLERAIQNRLLNKKTVAFQLSTKKEIKINPLVDLEISIRQALRLKILK